jgi:sterol desaturase/sphingolipid hydroxylase (fatty acid hydroxylase superfamily)
MENYPFSLYLPDASLQYHDLFVHPQHSSYHSLPMMMKIDIIIDSSEILTLPTCHRVHHRGKKGEIRRNFH